MDYGFLGNFERFELMAFFSGYAIIYVLLNGVLQGSRLFGVSKASILSYSYALTATLFFGYVVRKLFISSVTDIQTYFHHPFLYLLGSIAILFWIPVLNRRSAIRLIHSLVFFAMIPMDIISYSRGLIDKAQVANDMNMLTLSIVLNISTVACVFIFLWLSTKLVNRHPGKEI